MSIIDNDLNICYSGGSGGFYLLHYLLKFNQHWCHLSLPGIMNYLYDRLTQAQKDQLRISRESYQQCAGESWPNFEDYCKLYPNIPEPARSELSAIHSQWAENIDYISNGFDIKIKSISDRQWDIARLEEWKFNEVWPDNVLTKSNTGPRPYKIYFNGIDYYDTWINLPGKKLVIYTDIESELRLASGKRASMFHRKLKPPSISEIKKVLKNTYQYNNHTVSNNLKVLLDAADYTIYLQDLATIPQSVFGVPPTVEQQKFTQQWLNCHPESLLTKIGLNK